jgi:hypothetical protein
MLRVGVFDKVRMFYLTFLRERWRAFRATEDYRLARLPEAPLGNTESAMADIKTVDVKVVCVLRVPLVARPNVACFRLDFDVD